MYKSKYFFKENVGYLCNGMCFNNKSMKHWHMHATWKHYAKWKNQTQQAMVAYTILRVSKPIKKGSKLMILKAEKQGKRNSP